MKNNKSPGTDGFPADFFKFFWKDLGIFLIKSLNYGFKESCLSITQREGIIICIPKGNKDREYVKNWRPISLLNVTYKIASACIANRIKSVLPKIVNKDQTGFISGRFIGDNTRLIYDVLHYAKSNSEPGLLLLIDFEKAFDTIAWSFKEKVLEYFNFGVNIKNWISVFYTNIKSSVCCNGYISDWFSIQRGVRQGDPLSPYIFILCAEILAIMLRQNIFIKGFKLGEHVVLVSQYADDTSIILDGSKQSFEYTVFTVLEYAKFSGLNMNFEKTKVVWFGSKAYSETRYLTELNFIWNPKEFTILGVNFEISLEKICEINYETKLKDIQNIVQLW